MTTKSTKNGGALKPKNPISQIRPNDPNSITSAKDIKPVISQPKKSQFTYDARFQYNFCNFCENISLCCEAFLCTPCLYFEIYRATKESCICSFWNSFIMLNPGVLRTKVRSTFKLHGSIIEDNFYSMVCPCLTAIQLKQELTYRGYSK